MHKPSVVVQLNDNILAFMVSDHEGNTQVCRDEREAVVLLREFTRKYVHASKGKKI